MLGATQRASSREPPEESNSTVQCSTVQLMLCLLSQSVSASAMSLIYQLFVMKGSHMDDPSACVIRYNSTLYRSRVQ